MSVCCVGGTLTGGARRGSREVTRLSSVWDTRGCGSAWAAGQMAPAGEGGCTAHVCGCQGPHGKEAKGTVRKSPGTAVAT